MTTVFGRITFEEGTNGANLTSATGFVSIVGTPVPTYSNAHSLSGGGLLAGKIVASGGNVYLVKSNLASMSDIWVQVYMYVESMPTISQAIVTMLNGTSGLGELRLLTTGAFQLRNSGFTQIAVSSTGLVTAGKWIRFDYNYNNTTATQRLFVYTTNPNGTTADYDSGAIATTAAGTSTGFQVGAVSASSTATYYFDNIIVDNAAQPSPAVASNAPPTANAGADQTNVEPYSAVTLTGTDSDSDGSVVSRAWSGAGFTFLTGQTSATATAKVRGSIAGETLVATYTVTDNSGASTSDTVNVTVLPVTTRAAIGGVMVPMEIRAAQ